MKSALVAVLLLQCASATRFRATGVRLATGNATADLRDAAAIANGVEADARSDFQDAAAIRRAASIVSGRARAELARSADEAQDGAAIEKADKLWSAFELARGDKELKDERDRAQLAKAVKIEVAEEESDASQMKTLASKERADSEAGARRASQMGADASQIERRAMAKLEREGADVQALQAAAESESNATKRRNSCSAKVVSPKADLTIDIPNVVHGEVEFCKAGQLKVREGNCPISGHELPDAVLKTNGEQSECQTVSCKAYPCCMAFKCGGTVAWER